MKRSFLLLIAFFIFLFTPKSAFADEGWVIKDFHSDIAVEQTGAVYVQEHITVDFYSLQKHGIFREIPYVYESNGEEMYTEILAAGVSQDDRPAKYQFYREGSFVVFKIGDTDKTISGKHTYIVQYRVRGVLRGFDVNDEFFWNVTGNNWPVTIDKASATVIMPANSIQNTACYQGTEGSRLPCGSKNYDALQADFAANRLLSPGEGLTIVVAYDKGIVQIIAVSRPKTFFEKLIEPASITTLIVSLLFGLGTVVFIWFKYGRDYWFKGKFFPDTSAEEEVLPIGGHETIVVEFEPPDKLRPAELGVLVDERAHT
ncbi:MAG: DUF2207 domain-containing protein, partial [Candidatus Levybacteria bacterium]|nr:DUF2207 domain-containing protein [Candidatus Levybacteria bacterium]